MSRAVWWSGSRRAGTPSGSAGRKIEVKRLDLRPQAVEITAQEMLTKDRIALRVTLTAFRRIVDPERVVAAVPDVDAWLYRLVQFAIREAVAGRTLDEVLSAKAALDAELRDYVRARLADTGVEVTELGVKDVILPGEIRELVNKVVEAERIGEGQPDPPPGGDRGDAVAPEHRQADGGQPAAAAAQGAGVARAAGGEGRPHRPARGRRAGLRCAAHQAGSAEACGNGITRRVAHGRPFKP